MIRVQGTLAPLRRHLRTQSIGHGLKPLETRPSGLEVRFCSAVLNMQLVHVLVSLNEIVKLRACDLRVVMSSSRAHHRTTMLEVGLARPILGQVRVKRLDLLVPPH